MIYLNFKCYLFITLSKLTLAVRLYTRYSCMHIRDAGAKKKNFFRLFCNTFFFLTIVMKEQYFVFFFLKKNL
jgi:hypothetical protein